MTYDDLIVACRENPDDEALRAELLAAGRARVDAFYLRNADEYITRTR